MTSVVVQSGNYSVSYDAEDNGTGIQFFDTETEARTFYEKIALSDRNFRIGESINYFEYDDCCIQGRIRMTVTKYDEKVYAVIESTENDVYDYEVFPTSEQAEEAAEAFRRQN